MTISFHPDDAAFIDVDGLAIRFIQDSQTAQETPILITSPFPESVHAFHAIWPRLRDLGPLTAIDLPGFGRSQGRPDLVSPSAMVGLLPVSWTPR